MTDRGRSPRRPRLAPLTPLHVDDLPGRTVCLQCLVGGVVEPLHSRRVGKLRRSAGFLAVAALVTAGFAAPAEVPRTVPV
ncbi:MAG TPA: hypothetical protein VHN98_12770, partial [Acidimicrobiales bacterium]|nr:hypothetical protein [Acidimicrobiales bacterium]